MSVNKFEKPFNEWADERKVGIFRKTDSDVTNICEENDSSMKPEIELKEGSNGFVYKTDFLGHLQLVSLGTGGPKKLSLQNDPHNCTPDPPQQWNTACILPTVQERDQIAAWMDSQNHSITSNVYSQPKNVSDNGEDSYFVKEEPIEAFRPQCNYAQTLPEIYSSYSNQSWEETQSTNHDTGKQQMALLTEAEKKRLYRMRLKEENPSVWSSIKKRDAARKKEQRERRRNVIYEMQKAMECMSIPHSSEAEDNKLYLEALKERYPELWKQLETALPATQSQNEQKYRDRSMKSRRHEPKPVKMYKDVIEAHKKRLYRQRLKDERPDLYERQKAKDACSRSLQRFIKKTKHNGVHVKSFDPEEIDKKLTYLHNLQIEHMEMLEATTMNVPGASIGDMGHFIMKFQSGDYVPSFEFRTKKDTSLVCDNKFSSNFESEGLMNTLGCTDPLRPTSHGNSNDKKQPINVNPTAITHTNLSSHHYPTARSTQSDVLWYWNDMSRHHPSHDVAMSDFPAIGDMTQEERMNKISRERLHLKEKRRRYRLSMSPERRAEFLQFERQRLKAYRLKKKLDSEVMPIHHNN